MEAKAMEAKAFEDKAMEASALEVKAMEAKAMEAKAMEGKAMEEKAMEWKAKAMDAAAMTATMRTRGRGRTGALPAKHEFGCRCSNSGASRNPRGDDHDAKSSTTRKNKFNTTLVRHIDLTTLD